MVSDVRDRAKRRREAADRHELSAALHDDSAKYWLSRGDGEMADLERRSADIERSAAELERDRARLLEEREGTQ